jgi:DNA-binding SARP family transcriptional activator
MVVVQLLGSAIITCGEHSIRDSASRRFAIALYFAAERGRRLDRAATQALLFEDQAEPNAAHSFRQYLYKLGKLGFPVRAGHADLFVPADDVSTDVERILGAQRLTAEELTLVERGVLRHLAFDRLPGFNAWLEEFRSRTERDLGRALIRQLGAAREVGDWAHAERIARACLVLDPLNEEATLGLAESLAISGSKAAAVQLLEQYTSEVGISSADLKIPANVLRRRIAERLPDFGHRARTELPFVGRRDEMRVLAERLRSARAGDAQCALIYGEPGIGKTRLATEFANVAILEGARLVRVAAQPHDVHRPLAALVDLVPLLLQLPGALGCSPESMEALRMLTGRELAADAEAFVEMNPEMRYHRTTSSIRDLFDAVASECMLLVIVEDAHWLDRLSLQFIGGLAAERVPRRLLLVLTSRERHAVIQHARHADRLTLLHLDALNPEATSELARVALASAGGNQSLDLVQRIQETAGGNPLFMIALAEHWRNAGTRYSTPTSVKSLVSVQLCGLSPNALTVLHTVILLGAFCSPATLTDSLQVSMLEIADALQELEDASFISDHGGSIAPPHALVCEVCIEEAPPTKLRALHARIAEILGNHAAEFGGLKLMWEAAEHWFLAGSGDRAYRVLSRCADDTTQIGRPAEAAAILARAADLTSDAGVRIEALQRAALLSAEASESIQTVKLVSRIRELGGSVSPELAVHELAAVVHVDVSTASVPARLEEVVAASKSPQVAGQAALLLIKTADRLRDRRVAERALAIRKTAEPLATDLRLEFELVYETAFGSLEKAARIAREAIRHSDEMPSGARRLGRRHNAAQVLLVAGHAEEALPLFEEGYFTGLGTGLLRQPLASAFLLHAAARDEMRSETATLWRDRIRALAGIPGSISLSFLFVFDGCEALLDGDSSRLSAVAAELLEHASIRSVHTTNDWGYGFQAAAHHLCGEPADREIIAKLGSARSELRGFGADDLTVQVLAEDLARNGNRREASLLVQAYLQQYRQTRNAIWLGLRRTIERFGLARIAGTRQVTAMEPTPE